MAKNMVCRVAWHCNGVLEYRKVLTLNVAIQHIHLTQRKVEKINPADPVGDFTAAGKSWGGFLDLGIEF